MEPQQITFSLAALQVVVGLLGGMSLAVVALYGLLVKMWLDDRTALREERKDHRARTERLTTVLENLTETLKRRRS